MLVWQNLRVVHYRNSNVVNLINEQLISNTVLRPYIGVNRTFPNVCLLHISVQILDHYVSFKHKKLGID